MKLLFIINTCACFSCAQIMFIFARDVAKEGEIFQAMLAASMCITFAAALTLNVIFA
jgi:hypothetical protein